MLSSRSSSPTLVINTSNRQSNPLHLRRSLSKPLHHSHPRIPQQSLASSPHANPSSHPSPPFPGKTSQTSTLGHHAARPTGSRGRALSRSAARKSHPTKSHPSTSVNTASRAGSETAAVSDPLYMILDPLILSGVIHEQHKGSIPYNWYPTVQLFSGRFLAVGGGGGSTRPPTSSHMTCTSAQAISKKS